MSSCCDASSCSCSHSEEESNCSVVSSSSSSFRRLDSSTTQFSTQFSTDSGGEVAYEWFSESTDISGNVFYLNMLDDHYDDNDLKKQSEKDDCVRSSLSGESDQAKQSSFLKMQRLRSSYSKVTSWVFNKKQGSIKRKSSSSLKRKDKTTSSVSKTAICKADGGDDSSHAAAAAGPSISISTTEESALISLLKGTKSAEESQIYASNLVGEKFTLLFLTPPTENSSSDRDYLVFSFPKTNIDCTRENLLVKLKGMFITLSQVVNEITNQLPTLTKLAVNRRITNEEGLEDVIEETFLIGYVQEFNGILVIAIEEPVHDKVASISDLIHFVCSSIRFLFDSLAGGFTNSANHPAIEHLLTILSYSLFSEESSFQRDISHSCSLVQKLIIEDEELMLSLSDTLSEYEAMDWLAEKVNSRNDFNFNSSCEFIVVGSCLFYKGYLLTSHLPKYNVADISNYLQLRGIIELSRNKPVKLVNWLEVYPSRQKQTQTLTRDFNENEGARYFLLVVGVQHTLFSVLLEMPFVSVTTHIKADQQIMMQTLKFVTSNLNNSGLIDEVDRYLALQKQFYHSNFFSGSDRDKLNGQPSLRSLSLRDLFQSSFSSASSSKNVTDSTELSTRRSVHSLLSPGDHFSTSKSYSTPSLATTARTNVSTTSTISGTCDSPSFTSCNDTESSCHHSSLTSFNLQVQYDSMRRRFPSSLLLFLDVDERSGTFVGPVMQSPANKRLANDIIPMFREACIYLKAQIDAYYPSVNEYGSYFSVKNCSPASLTPSKVKARRHQDYMFDNCFWICCRKESAHRTVFACYRLTPRSLVISMESLAYSLELQSKE